MFLIHIIWKTVGAIYNQQNACFALSTFDLLQLDCLLKWPKFVPFLCLLPGSCVHICHICILFYFLLGGGEKHCQVYLAFIFYMQLAGEWSRDGLWLQIFHHQHHTTLIFFQCDQSKQLCKRLSLPVFKSVLPRQGFRHRSRWHEFGMSEEKLLYNSEKLVSKPKLGEVIISEIICTHTNLFTELMDLMWHDQYYNRVATIRLTWCQLMGCNVILPQTKSPSSCLCNRGHIM